MEHLKKNRTINMLTIFIFCYPAWSFAIPALEIATAPVQLQADNDYVDDSIITMKVKSKLLQSNMDLTGLTVTTNNQVVILTGFLPKRDDKLLAEELAKQVQGVKKIENNIVIDNSDVTLNTYTQDSVITTEIKTKFMANGAINSTDIHVVTKNGIVLLTGTVPNKEQLSEIEKIISSIEDVRRIVNQLTIDEN